MRAPPTSQAKRPWPCWFTVIVEPDLLAMRPSTCTLSPVLHLFVAATNKCKTGDNVQVEGLIASKSGSTITVNQQGQGLFACEVGGARIRTGNTTYTVAQLQ